MKTWSRLMCFCVILLAVQFGPFPAQAAQVVLPSVTYRCQNAPLRDALKDVFEQIRVRYRIDPAVTGRVSASIQGVLLSTALEVLLSGHTPSLTYAVEDGVYHVSPLSHLDTSADISPDGKVRVEASRAVLWPPPMGRISGPAPTEMLDGAVTVRTLAAGIRLRVVAGGDGDRLSIEEIGPGGPVTLWTMHFDVRHEVVETTDNKIVFRDETERSLTLDRLP